MFHVQNNRAPFRSGGTRYAVPGPSTSHPSLRHCLNRPDLINHENSFAYVKNYCELIYQ
jgi:hypothetical protein